MNSLYEGTYIRNVVPVEDSKRIGKLVILLNSIFGVTGQLTKNIVFDEFLNFWPLFLCVLIGGQIGNYLNIKFLSNKTLALITSLLVIFVAIRMGLRLIS